MKPIPVGLLIRVFFFVFFTFYFEIFVVSQIVEIV